VIANPWGVAYLRFLDALKPRSHKRLVYQLHIIGRGTNYICTLKG